MTHRNIKIGVTAFVLVGAFLGLLWSTLQDGTEYYKHVDEVLASPQQWEGKRLQLHGFAFDVRRKPDTLEYKFKVRNKDKVIEATYTGIVPDTFQNDAEVVLQGKLTPEGAFHATGVMAKCPSKYEAIQKVG